MYEINKVEEVDEIESMESFKTSPYYAPMVYKRKVITYVIKDLQFDATSLISSGRVAVNTMKLSTYMKNNNLQIVTKQVIEDAMELAKKYAITRVVDGKRVNSTEAFLSRAEDTDSIPYKCYELIKNSNNLLSSFSKLTSKLLKEDRVTDVEYLHSYIYCHTSSWVDYKDHNKYIEDSDIVVQENIAYSLLDVYYDLLEERSVNTPLEMTEYMSYLCHLGYGVCEMQSILQEVIKRHELWDSLTFDEINELLSVLDEEELENVDISEVIKG